jgi:hypothetical protein
VDGDQVLRGWACLLLTNSIGPWNPVHHSCSGESRSTAQHSRQLLLCKKRNTAEHR